MDNLSPEQVALLTDAELARECAERETLQEFADRLRSMTLDLDPDIAAALNRNFWGMFEPIEAETRTDGTSARAEAALLAAIESSK